MKLGVLGVLALFAAAAPPSASPPFGLDARAAWVGSRVVGSPDPPDPYVTERVFPALPLVEPLDLTWAPGSDRLFVVDRDGRVRAIDPRKPDGSDAPLVMDLARPTYAIAFHPRFAENRSLFVYSRVADKPIPIFRLSRVQLTRDEPPRLQPGSEVTLLEHQQRDHFGGSLHFGPDGYLYTGVGDGGGIGDPTNTGQDLSDLRSSMLRLDVDHPAGGKPYGIPRDNPFVHTPGARPEIFAFGLRNPWRFSFDRDTGALWVGDVGQDLWEMIDVVRKGGNYGWSVREGKHDYHPERRKGPGAIVAPIMEHPHSEARSITGGFVYRGKRLPELRGAYVYGDFDTGNVWALRWNGRRVTWARQLVDTALRVVAFGEDRDGELYVLSYTGEIHRLAPAPPRAPQAPFPAKLSETGLFASVATQTPAAGVIPYDVVSPLWSDGAHKQRFVAIPGGATLRVKRWPGGFEYPDGSVLVKTFALELEPGNAASRRRVETRLWTLQGGHWRGYTYAWNDAGTDAALVGAGGLDRTYAIRDARAPGGVRQQRWHIPSRSECSLCHTMPAAFVLGFTPEQLDRDHDYGPPGSPRVDNQLRAFTHAGLLEPSVWPRKRDAAHLVDPSDETAPIEARARSYLHANCSHCHRPWGGGYARFDVTIQRSLADAHVVDAPAERSDLGIAGARVIAPGDPDRSLLYRRMLTLGPGRMPSLASAVVDVDGAAVVRAWIASLPPGPSGYPTP